MGRGKVEFKCRAACGAIAWNFKKFIKIMPVVAASPIMPVDFIAEETAK